ncbi:MAG TPA: oxygen-independent coproporphyrinogen III oxidase, partial [Thiolinea sp.]|nr:oxygen-independent coproporphyrinogen III oxidase [Thiolinea sp.]
MNRTLNSQASAFDAELVQRYDRPGPRYTSYPTAVAFGTFSEADYRACVRDSNEYPIPVPLSLYFHIPFCDTVCFYCACNKIATKDRSLARTYLDYLAQEIRLQAGLFDADRRVEQLHWGGGTPTFLDHEQMRWLMQKTREHFQLYGPEEDAQADYSIEIDPRSVSPDTIALLRHIGFNRFSLGIQDVDARVQRAVNRIQPLSQSRAIIDACRSVDARSVSVDLIYGLPLQTLAGFRQTLIAVADLGPDRISVFNYAHMPELFMPQRRIRVEELPAPALKLELLQLAVEYLTGIGYQYIGMDHFARPGDELALAQKRGTLYRNFQGYTTHADCDLIGMGVSAISSVENCYSQHVKSLEEYYFALDQGQLPVSRGIRLTADDGVRRAVIQQLSCHFMLDFRAIGRRFNLEFATYFATELHQLATMAQDGLLELSDAGLQVTPQGRFLIRNICMVFDLSLRSGQL